MVSKHELYQKFKFSICFENVADISGYVTEKIFDAMLAGSDRFIEVLTTFANICHKTVLLIIEILKPQRNCTNLSNFTVEDTLSLSRR